MNSVAEAEVLGHTVQTCHDGTREKERGRSEEERKLGLFTIKRMHAQIISPALAILRPTIERLNSANEHWMLILLLAIIVYVNYLI